MLPPPDPTQFTVIIPAVRNSTGGSPLTAEDIVGTQPMMGPGVVYAPYIPLYVAPPEFTERRQHPRRLDEVLPGEEE